MWTRGKGLAASRKKSGVWEGMGRGGGGGDIGQGRLRVSASHERMRRDNRDSFMRVGGSEGGEAEGTGE